MKVKVSETTRTQLDWLVAKCEGAGTPYVGKSGKLELATARYSTDPAQGQPILERERLILRPCFDGGWESAASPSCWQSGPTMLIAGLRCYVASKLGDEVEIPEELL